MTRVAAGALGLLLAAAGCSGPGGVTRVVVVTFDTTRADRLGCYGYDEASTPNLDRLAAESVVFEQAVSPIPTTLPSHSTMFTGLYPQDHGVRYNLIYRLGPEARTLAEVLRDQGFATAGFPASFVVGPQFGIEQGFDTFPEPPRRRDAGNHPDKLMRSAGEGTDLALAWLDDHAGERAFVWLHYYDPHYPYTPPFPWSANFRERPYDGEIAYADAQFGRLLERLRADPAWSSTLLIVAGDHGEGLYHHDERWHSLLTYEGTQRVPLIIRAPGSRPDRVGEPVTLADLTPTVLDLVGVPVPPNLRGVSLRPALDGDDPPRRDLYFESLAGALNYGWAELRGLRFGNWKLIDSTSPELYDLAADPEERNNLATLEPQRLQDLRAALTALSEPITEESQATAAQGPLLDAETEAFLASLGYVGGGSGGSAENARNPRELIDLETEMIGAQNAVAAGDWERLEEVTGYILGRDPTNKWALVNLGTALIEQDRPREAQDQAAELLRIYPDKERGYALLARAYQAQGQIATAYEVLQRGRAAVPESVLLSYLVLVAEFDLEKPGVCTESVPATLARLPASGLVLVLRARCEARAGQLDTALLTLTRAVQLGFAQLRALEQIDEFAAVRELPGFDKLLARAESSADGPGS